MSSESDEFERLGGKGKGGLGIGQRSPGVAKLEAGRATLELEMKGSDISRREAGRASMAQGKAVPGSGTPDATGPANLHAQRHRLKATGWATGDFSERCGAISSR